MPPCHRLNEWHAPSNLRVWIYIYTPTHVTNVLIHTSKMYVWLQRHLSNERHASFNLHVWHIYSYIQYDLSYIYLTCMYYHNVIWECTQDALNPICMCECKCILHCTCTCAHITHLRSTTTSLVELRTRSIHSACVNIHTYSNTHDTYSYIHHTWHIFILDHT